MKKTILLSLLPLVSTNAIIYHDIDCDVYYNNQNGIQVKTSFKIKDFKNIGFSVSITKSMVSLFAYFGFSSTTLETEAGVSCKASHNTNRNAHRNLHLNSSLYLSRVDMANTNTMQAFPPLYKLGTKCGFEQDISNNCSIEVSDIIGFEARFSTEER